MIAAALAVWLLAAGPANGAPAKVVVFAEGNRQATVDIPPGWVLHQQPATPAGLAFHREGRAGGPTLVVRLLPRPPGDEEAIREAVFAPFEKPGRLGGRGFVAPSVWTADGQHLWWVRNFVDDDGRPSHTVTFVAEPDRVVMFSVQATSLQALQAAADAFRQLVGSYRVERTDRAGRLLALWKRSGLGGHLAALAPLGFAIAFWWGLWRLLGLVGGWPFLARVYRARQPFGGPRTGWITGAVGSVAYHVMTVGADGRGLHVAVPRLLVPGHRSLFFPWGEVQDVTMIRGRWSGGPKLAFRFRRSRVQVHLPADLEDWLGRQAGPAWPGDRSRTASPPSGR